MFTLEQTVKARKGSRGVALLFLNLDARLQGGGGGVQRQSPVA